MACFGGESAAWEVVLDCAIARSSKCIRLRQKVSVFVKRFRGSAKNYGIGRLPVVVLIPGLLRFWSLDECEFALEVALPIALGLVGIIDQTVVWQIPYR